MSLYTWHCQGIHKPSSCATFTLNSHWGRAATGKKNPYTYAHKVSLVVSNSLRSCGLIVCGLPGFSVRQGDSLGKNTGVYWPILVAIPF